MEFKTAIYQGICFYIIRYSPTNWETFNPSIPHFPQDKHHNAKKDGPRTLAEAVPLMYLSFLLLFLLTLWFPVHRNNMIAVRAPGLCLHWLRGSGADIHDTLSAPWAFQSLHSCPPPRIQPRFLAAGALTWRLSHCLPPVKFLSTLSRQESLLPHVPPSISSVLSQTRPNRRPCL